MLSVLPNRRRGNTYTWNVRNKLATTTGLVPASFVYDGTGRRRAKTISGSTTNFLYDGINPIQEQAGASVRNLLTGLGVDEYLTRDDGAGLRLFLADALGSTIALVDNTAAVQGEYTYEPFGATTATGTLGANTLTYTGREDDETGLKYYRARYYDPHGQRFVSEDPIGLWAGDTNRYVYVRNNPMHWTDPEGLRILNPTRRPISAAVRRALEDFNACIGYDKDIAITSGDRPRSSPLGVGAASRHAQGIAADFVVPGQAHSVTAYQAIASGLFGGVGWYEEGYRGPQNEGPHVHVDLRRTWQTVTYGHDRDGNYYEPLPALPPEALSGRKGGCPAGYL
jgi:RHS repeat-associated protein